jgi:uroporphyrinogen decarboxylase
VEPWDVTGVSYPYRWGFSAEPAAPEAFFPPYHDRTLREVLRLGAGRFSVHGEVFSPFSQLLELLTIKEGLMALLTEPAKVHACLDRLTAGAAELARREAALGVDAVLISSAYAGGGFISQDDYRAFVLPYERRVIEAVKRERDCPVYTHTCGAIGDRLELMLETGTEGIDTLDPPPLGTVELADAVRRLKGKAFIKGNLDPVGTLLRGDRGQVLAAARERIETAAPGGSYILSSACSVPPHTPPENVACLREAVDRWGRYDASGRPAT